MINGILNIYKEKGYTSHDVVARLRGIVGQKKIGHTGTLDPDAEGVLPVCLGRATKICALLTDKDKIYEAVLILGKTTDTQDISGKVLQECDTDVVGKIDEEQVISCIEGFVGEYDQMPPMYSALKVNGKKLYELAREGKTVERKRRKVTIHAIRIKELHLPRVRMEVECSKGTYIRTLCHDIGEKLGVGGCMESLLRTRVSSFGIEDSLKLDEIEEAVKSGRLAEVMLTPDEVFADLGAVTVQEKYVPLAYNGNPFSGKCITEDRIDFAEGDRFRVYDSRRRFIGIYRYDNRSRQFRIEKMFLDPEELKKQKD